MFVADSMQQPPEPMGAYEQPSQQQAIAAMMVPIVPPEVVLAMRFIEHCNTITAAKAFVWTDGDEPFEARLHIPEMHPFQEAAFRRACIRLGRYFDGTGARNQ